MKSTSPALLLLLAACDATPTNQERCEAFLRDQSCGTTDFGALLDCEAFVTEETCDLQPYFDCLAANGTCDETVAPPVFDDAGWATCAPKATCATLETDTDGD